MVATDQFDNKISNSIREEGLARMFSHQVGLPIFEISIYQDIKYLEAIQKKFLSIGLTRKMNIFCNFFEK